MESLKIFYYRNGVSSFGKEFSDSFFIFYTFICNLDKLVYNTCVSSDIGYKLNIFAFDLGRSTKVSILSKTRHINYTFEPTFQTALGCFLFAIL